MTERGNTISRSTGSGGPVTDAHDTDAQCADRPRALPSRSTAGVPSEGSPPGSGPSDGEPSDGEPSDESLLARAASGDHDAFARLYRRHRQQLLATALRTIRDHADAEDCVQEGVLRAFQLSPTFRGDCRVASWLHRIVINACLDRARRNQVRASLPMPDDLSGLGSDEGRSAEDMDRRLSVAAALRMLPEDQRAAVIAVDMHGLSVAQAAAVLGVAVGTVKSRRARARARLERLLL